MRKLDFPKGKVDQGESTVNCALREIYEETQLRLHHQINVNQFVKVETIKHRMVTLYFVEGIEEDSVRATSPPAARTTRHARHRHGRRSTTSRWGGGRPGEQARSQPLRC